MKHQLTYLKGFDEWEILYLDGEKYLEADKIELVEVFEMLAGLSNACEITIYEVVDLDSLDEVELFFYRTSKLEDVAKFLRRGNLFKKIKVV